MGESAADHCWVDSVEFWPRRMCQRPRPPSHLDTLKNFSQTFVVSSSFNVISYPDIDLNRIFQDKPSIWGDPHDYGHPKNPQVPSSLFHSMPRNSSQLVLVHSPIPELLSCWGIFPSASGKHLWPGKSPCSRAFEWDNHLPISINIYKSSDCPLA